MADFTQNQATMLQIQQLLQQLVPLLQQQNQGGQQQEGGQQQGRTPNYWTPRNEFGGTESNPLATNLQGQSAAFASNPRMQAMLDVLGGQSEELGSDPHLATLNNIMQRLEGGRNSGYANAFYGKTGPNAASNNIANMFGDTAGGSGMNAWSLANKPLSGWQRAGQFGGDALQDLAPVAAGIGSVFGPVGTAIGGGGAYLGGKALSYASQPYQLQ